ncbi:hypothetical protein TCE0_033r08236 [Talaromyces pinophilus]|uniref:Uncharacterized protein n=1 Tax=Talaromyces pinophilus TaxID=128442 RepID=A0A6V8H9V5_TALPI|nr:hypothetical protein TCE0_033r08236 [Talaromyces pinophilus]
MPSNIISIAVPDRQTTSSESRCIELVNEFSPEVQLQLRRTADIPQQDNLVAFLQKLAETLQLSGIRPLSEATYETVSKCTTPEDFGGYGFGTETPLTASQEADVVFLYSAFIEAVKSEERARSKPQPLRHRPKGRRPMTMAEKVFAAHDVSQRGYVRPGDIIQVDVDWILASELSWQGIETVYSSVGRPGIFRNDRFWLAGDHRVEPELYDQPKVRKLMELSERAQKDFKMTDFQGFNYTILHTEFVRERAQPGMLCIGADSHSCSAGAVSCLSIGMGSTDVCIPLVTGQTWLTVPKTVNICFTGKPPKGIGGKDTILYILKEFKRNTIAADRVIEFTGPGIKYLSCDARFAIANMCTEFGAITGIFESDERTVEFIDRRRVKKHRNSAIYYRADEDAEYEASYEIDLSKVESFVAVYPAPDNVLPVSEMAGTRLDGTFIGACTTAEEDLIIAAFVLKAGLDRGLELVHRGRRIVVPGSKPIRHKLQELGLLDVYARAGFKVRVPGCSMCVGQGIDQAAPGEVWLSSQNRNFKNRMGPGSIANLSSAATVAASSFNMEITDPRPLLDAIDMTELERCLGYLPFTSERRQSKVETVYSEPYGMEDLDDPESGVVKTEEAGAQSSVASGEQPTSINIIQGKPLILGDFIDTDAIIPSNFIAGNTGNESLGAHCMEYFMPEFRSRVQSGEDIIVAGNGFGCGSSRDVAVNALLGAGVKCVIAKSFAFIYARNQPNIGLLGIVIADDKFHTLVKETEKAEITIDVGRGVVSVAGEEFPFQLSEMEKSLIAAGGLTEAFKKFGKGVFDTLCRQKVPTKGSITDIEAVEF